jgi:hypothetical protein
LNQPTEKIMASGESTLYPPTKAILERCGALFFRVDAHDESDPESSDFLWIELTPDDTFSEGEVLTVSPMMPDRQRWFVSRETANEFGGWVTHWYVTGTSSEVFDHVLAALNKPKCPAPAQK